MASNSDPYRELEMYLEKAQEEIGKAFEELRQHEAASIRQSWNDVLPPPPAFQSLPDHVLCCGNQRDRNCGFSQNMTNRVYDRNVLDKQSTLPRQKERSTSPYLLQKSLSCYPAFPQCTQARGYFSSTPRTDCSTNFASHKFRPKLFRSAVSFPENSMDTFLRENVLVKEAKDYYFNKYGGCSCSESHRESIQRTNLSCHPVYLNSSVDNFESYRFRQRSYSETLSSNDNYFCTEDNIFPRPPSGDVNLLSIWADNLVLEIDKAMPVDLDDTLSSYSPLSDYSLSPIKNDDDNHSGLNNGPHCEDDKKFDENGRPLDKTSFQNGDTCKFNGIAYHLKSMSPSPDSGIGPILSEASEVDGMVNYVAKPINDLSESREQKMIAVYEENNVDGITPPPPGFEGEDDETTRVSKSLSDVNSISSNTREAETQVRRKKLKVATCETEQIESLIETEHFTKGINRHARIIPTVSLDLEDCATLTTTCAVSNAPWNGAVFNGIEAPTKNQSSIPNTELLPTSKDNTFTNGVLVKDVTRDTVCYKPQNLNETPKQKETMHFSTLPKQVNTTKDNDRYSCSLPRDAGRPQLDNKNNISETQRSASSSAMSSVSKVSVEELADFMSKVKKSTYYPPPHADASVNVKRVDDEDIIFTESNRDAITQTTPDGNLSRSSSFTWVTECDCSDPDSPHQRSASSDDSMLGLSCIENFKKKISSSSQSASTDEDEYEPPQSSECSSLYLSACSEASDSIASDSEQEGPNDSSRTKSNIKNVCLKENTFSKKVYSAAGILTDIAEEEALNSIKSCKTSASPSLANESISSSATSPSTSNLEDNYRGQPIEAEVLIVNDLDKEVKPTVLMRPKKQRFLKKENITSSKEPSVLKSKSGSELTSVGLSSKDQCELQAIEACRWLRATGFPQYAQMYEDNQFPIDICTVQKDHDFLHPDSIQSLFRRLNTLNRCARMKFVENIPRKSVSLDESDDEEQCALSENWQFQRISRRWSRVPSPPDAENESGVSIQEPPSSPKSCRHPVSSRNYLAPEEAYCSSHDSVFVDDHHNSPDSLRRLTLRTDEQHIPAQTLQNSPVSSSGSGGTLSVGSEEMHEKNLDSNQKNLHRSGSDRIKESAKALLRRMESLKGKRKKKVTDAKKVENSSPSLNNTGNGTDGSSCSSIASSPSINKYCRVRVSSPQDASDLSLCGTPQLNHRKKGWSFHRSDHDTNAHSDSECPIFLISETWKDANSNDTKLSKNSLSPIPTLTVPEITSRLNIREKSNRSKTLKETKSQKKKNVQHISPSNQELEKSYNRTSHYDNLPAPLAVFNNACVEGIDKETHELGKSKSPSDRLNEHGNSDNNDAEIIIVTNDRRDSGVGASLTRGSTQLYAPWHSFLHRSISATESSHRIIPITNLSAPQVLLLRKVSLLKLTTLMEKFSPTSRTGWSWAVPKFIRRFRAPDYKDKMVFGVPLLLILQRTGQPLPNCIQDALHFLRSNALDSTGLFRKSGVRSRIQKLRTLNESNPESVSYEDHQAYDVADMVKQYFRELPEALLTNKLSETFITIFQYIPPELRLEAIQAAILLMPDENREVLQALLSFLQEVCEHSQENKMTPTNLAVCFAPSLFNLSSLRSTSASPKRRKTVGTPDNKDLSENKAAYECLSTMVDNFQQLCSVAEDTFSQSRLPGIDDYKLASLDELSSLVNKDYRGWKTYIESCIQTTLKESKDKYKGWVGVCQTDNVDLAFKKVGDGHPLRLWKVSTEVEAPPSELLNRLVRERHSWDPTFLEWRVLQILDKQTEIFQYASSSVPPHPSCDYCVVRSWRTELPKGACILIEASIDHSEACILADGVRAVILASRYLIEPCGSGKSRVTHISRVDTRGRSPEWYHRAYGHIAILNLIKLRESFSLVRAAGPETKV